jgi:outer membrane protein assembly factor BamB
MVYEKFHELREIFGFSTNDGLMACCEKKGTIRVMNSASCEEVWNTNVQNGSLLIWYDDILYARNAMGQGANHFFTKNGDHVKEFNLDGFRYSIDWFCNMVTGRAVFYAVSNNGARKVGLLDIRHQEPFWLRDLEAGRSFQTPDFVFSLLASADAHTIIACLSASEGELLWRLDLKSALSRPASVYESETKYQFRITKLVAMYANRLIVGVTWDPATHRLLAIDCKTGQIDHYWSEIALKTTAHAQQILDGSRVLYLHGNSRFEKETQCLELDFVTGDVIRNSVVQSLLQEELVLRAWTLNDGKIYFTALKNERFPTHIGILDYATLDLLWWQKIEIDGNAFLEEGKGPEVDGDRCYVLDTQGTLHFFRERK